MEAFICKRAELLKLQRKERNEKTALDKQLNKAVKEVRSKVMSRMSFDWEKV